MTSVSLFARATVLPASSAAQVPVRPALPTTAATTTSTSGSRTICSKPACQRAARFRGAGRPVEVGWRPPRRSPPRIAAEIRWACSHNSFSRRWAERATTCKLALRCRDHLQRAAADAAGRAEEGDFAGRVVHSGRLRRAEAMRCRFLARFAQLATIGRSQRTAERSRLRC